MRKLYYTVPTGYSIQTVAELSDLLLVDAQIAHLNGALGLVKEERSHVSRTTRRQ